MNTQTTTTRTVAICDLNAAVAARDKDMQNPSEVVSVHTEICLLAQFAMRVTGEKCTGSTMNDAAFESNPDFYKFHVYSTGMRELVRLFDRAYQSKCWSELAYLRKLLPMDVQVTIEER